MLRRTMHLFGYLFSVLMIISLVIVRVNGQQTTPPPPAFPILPTAYSSDVNINFADEGFTLNYHEVYHSQYGNRFDGRMYAPYYQEYYTVGSSTPILVDSRTLALCYQLPNASAFDNHRSSFDLLFSLYNLTISSLQYSGLSYNARNLPADVYIGNGISERRFGNFTLKIMVKATLYITNSALLPSYPRIPLKADIEGGIYVAESVDQPMQLVRNYTATISWFNFQPNAQKSDVTPLSTNCGTVLPNDAQASRPNWNRTDAIPKPPPTGSLPIPPLPTQFSTYVEGKFVDGSSERISTLLWRFSIPSSNLPYCSTPSSMTCRSERVDFIDPIQNINQKSLFNFYPPEYTGEVVAVGISTVFSNNNCVQNQLRSYSSSPLSSLRAGFIPEIFSSPSALYSAYYIGRTNVRGIPADTWIVKNNVRVDASTNREFRFDSTLYFAPDQWQFIGRESMIPSGARLPVRIINNGTVTQTLPTGLKVSTVYSDLYDFFGMRTELQDPAKLTQAAICTILATTPPPNNPNTNTDGSVVSTGKILGGIIGGIGGAIVLFFVLKCAMERQSKASGARLPSHQIIDATDSHQTSSARTTQMEVIEDNQSA